MKNLQLNIIISVILGVIAGFFASDFINVYTFLGKAFITLLKYIVVPLVFASLISGVISLGSVSSLRIMGIKTLFYFIITTCISASIGILLAIGINPGKGFSLQPDSAELVTEALSINQLLLQIIPTDFIGFISGGNMLFLILISILIGILIITIGRNISFPIDELFEGFNDFMMIITNWVIAFSPIGIFGLVAQLIVTTGAAAFIPLLKCFKALKDDNSEPKTNDLSPPSPQNP